MTATTESADVLVIGGGTSGGIAARHFAEAGLAVTVLEQGRWIDPGELPGNTPEYELLADRDWYPDPNVRDNPSDYPVDNSESDIPIFLYNAVGGTSLLYGAIWPRPQPSHFRVKTVDGLADDWPIGYQDLLPFYELIDKEMGVSGMAGNPAYPPGPGPPLPAFPIHYPGHKMAAAMNELGWHWWPGSNAIPSQDYGQQHGCVRYGVCRMGCPHAAKSSTDITHFTPAVQKGAKVITRARVARISVNNKGVADGAIYLKDGREYFQPASIVVVAANAIGTARLLLMSTSRLFPNGLANNSGLVGKRLMLHPYSNSVGIYDDEFADWLGPAGEYIHSMEFSESDSSRGFVRGARWSLMPMGGPLDTVRHWLEGERQDTEDFWGPPFAEKMQRSVGHMMQWSIVPEDLPDPDNFVTLDQESTDSDGLPGVKVRYRISENTRRLVDFNLSRSMEAHTAAGATDTWVSVRHYTSGHNTGTARMGTDPAESVVDIYGQAHDVPNLFLIDGSVFPTSTGVNVTPTICALAKRTATYITDKAGSEEVPG